MPGRIARVAWAIWAALLSACTMDVAEERAQLDEEVGFGDAGGVALRVTDGLAAIRQLAPGKLVLWAQSPVLEIEAAASESAVTEWTISVENCMPDAELRAETSEGEPLEVVATAEEHACPTHRAWTIRLLPGRRSTLRMSPPDATATVEWRFRTMTPSLNADERIEMVVSAGDISGGGGESNMLAVQEAMRELRVPFYSVVGNSDSGSTLSEAWHQLFGRHSFRFAFRGVAFSFVDSASASVALPVYEWLDGWIGDAGARPHVVITHVPPLDPLGSRSAGFRSRNEAGKLLNLLARGNVALLICGHLHLYYNLEQAGIPTLIGGREGEYSVVDVDPTRGSFATARVWSPAP